MRIRAAWNIMNAIYGCRQPATEPSKKKCPQKPTSSMKKLREKNALHKYIFVFNVL